MPTKRVERLFRPPFVDLYRPLMQFTSLLRNGENQRTRAALFRERQKHALSIENWKPARALNFAADVSKIALVDIERATRTALAIACVFEKNWDSVPDIAVGVKHGNVCGAAIGTTPEAALKGMIEGDPRALFGGTVVTNFAIDTAGAQLLHDYGGYGHGGAKRVIASLGAPHISDEAYEELFRKSRALVALQNPALARLCAALIPAKPVFRQLPLLGAWVAEEPDLFVLDFKDDRIRIEQDPQRVPHDPFEDTQVLKDIALAQAVCWTSNSNTITIARDGRVLSNAVGGQDRVGACEAAGRKLPERERNAPGNVAASDSFFPFSDGLLMLRSYGVRIVFTTQGGQREREVAEEARTNGMSLMWLPDKVARGFFGH